jgi:hypothetical protein
VIETFSSDRRHLPMKEGLYAGCRRVSRRPNLQNPNLQNLFHPGDCEAVISPGFLDRKRASLCALNPPIQSLSAGDLAPVSPIRSAQPSTFAFGPGQFIGV